MDTEHYLSVSALSQYLSKKFDVDPYLKRVYVKGEVSNYNNRRQGTQYFNLKDDKAILSAICFKKMPFELEEGMQVLVIGTVKLSAQYGNYKIHVDDIALSGTGELFQKFKQLKDKLNAEGLFDLPKKAICRFPKRIAVITSESGAVIHDIQTTILRRFPIVAIDVFPTIVQGKDSAKSIVNSLQRIQQSSNQYDTVIVARGGGSIEDLWSFNEEVVVRAIAEFPYPIISSIGHETDTTLTDFVADLRMPTPTAAAEAATPVLVDIKKSQNQLLQRLQQTMARQLKQVQQRYHRNANSYIFLQPTRLYDSYVLKLKRLETQFCHLAQQSIKDTKQLFDKNIVALQTNSPMRQITQYDYQLQQLSATLLTRQEGHQTQKQGNFELLVQRLDLLSPLKNMARGYSIVLKDDAVVTSTRQLQIDDTVSLEMGDGTVKAIISNIEEKDR